MTLDLKQQVAVTSLNAMMKKNYFSICTIRDVANMLEINPDCEAFKMLTVLHCVNWVDMPPDVRDSVPDLIYQCLSIKPVYVFKTAQVINTIEEPKMDSRKKDTSPKSSMWKRLVGKT